MPWSQAPEGTCHRSRRIRRHIRPPYRAPGGGGGDRTAPNHSAVAARSERSGCRANRPDIGQCRAVRPGISCLPREKVLVTDAGSVPSYISTRPRRRGTAMLARPHRQLWSKAGNDGCPASIRRPVTTTAHCWNSRIDLTTVHQDAVAMARRTLRWSRGRWKRGRMKYGQADGFAEPRPLGQRSTGDVHSAVDERGVEVIARRPVAVRAELDRLAGIVERGAIHRQQRCAGLLVEQPSLCPGSRPGADALAG